MVKQHNGSFYRRISSRKHVIACYEGPTWPNEQFCRWAIIGDHVKTPYFAQNHQGNMLERPKTVKNDILRWAIIGERAKTASERSKQLRIARHHMPTGPNDHTPTPNTPSVEEFNIRSISDIIKSATAAHFENFKRSYLRHLSTYSHTTSHSHRRRF